MIIHRRTAEFQRQFESQTANRLFAVLDDDLINAGFLSMRGAAEGDRAAGLRLQTECGVFDRMGHGHDIVANAGL